MESAVETRHFIFIERLGQLAEYVELGPGSNEKWIQGWIVNRDMVRIETCRIERHRGMRISRALPIEGQGLVPVG